MAVVAMLLIGNIRTDGRVQKEIRTLRSRGFAVTLIQWAHSGERSGHEHLGIQVIDYPYRLHRLAAVNFLLQLSFNLFAWRHLKRLAPDIIQCNDLNTLLAGFLLRHRVRLIYDCHELFPEQYGGVRKHIWSLLERLLVRGCHAYIQAEENRLTYFADKHHIDPKRIALVENFPPSHYVFSGRNRLRERFGFATSTVILLYTGVLGPGRDIERMIRSMALLDTHFALVLLGPTFKNYEAELAAHIEAARVTDRVRLHPQIPNTEMLDYMNSCDIGLVFYRNTNLNNYWCASNKLYEFIRCGKPLITNDYPGLRKVVERNSLGVCLPDTSPESIASAVRRIRNAGRPPLVTSIYLWERQEGTYLSLFE